MFYDKENILHFNDSKYYHMTSQIWPLKYGLSYLTADPLKFNQNVMGPQSWTALVLFPVSFRYIPCPRSGVLVACIHRASSVIDWRSLYFLAWTYDIEHLINGIRGELSWWWWSSCPHLTYHEARHMSHLESFDNSKLSLLVFKIKLFKPLSLTVTSFKFK